MQKFQTISCEHPNTMVTKCEWKVLYFKEDIVGGRHCLSVDVSGSLLITNVPFKNG